MRRFISLVSFALEALNIREYSSKSVETLYISIGRGSITHPAQPDFDLRNRGHKGTARLPYSQRHINAQQPASISLALIAASQQRQATLIVHYQPTLSQMWPEREAGPPFTFKISMLHVFCSSHGLAHFAALFIDPRAK
jgi:hypothetical protein